MPSRKPAAPPVKSKGKVGRPPHVPADKDRLLVRLLTAGGIHQDRIAVALDIPERTLKRHYKREIKMGQTEIDAQSVGALVSAMQRGGKEAVAAAKWWQQSRMGWSERIVVDDGKPADTPMRVVVEFVGDAPVSSQPQSDYPPPRQNGGIRLLNTAVELKG